MDPDPRMLEAINAAGLGDPASGTGVQFHRPRREFPVPQRPYPFQGELLQDLRQLSPRGRQGFEMLDEALKGVIERNDYTETFGVSRAPIGHVIDPFMKVQLVRDLPFEMSTVAPFFGDKATNDEFQRRLRPYLVKGGKYPATMDQIRPVAHILKELSLNQPFQVLIRQGLAEGPRRGAPLMRDAFVASLILESMATQADAPMPETADLKKPGVVHGVRRPASWSADVSPTKRSLGRSNQIYKLMAELAILEGKGSSAGGPLLADTFTMFEERMGPSVGLRKQRSIQAPPLIPYAGAEFPLVADIERRGIKDVGAERGYEVRGSASKEFRALTPEQAYRRTIGTIQRIMTPKEFSEFRRTVGNISGRPIEEKTKLVMRAIKDLHGQSAVERISEEARGEAQARQERGKAPSPTRGGTVAREYKITTKERSMLKNAEKAMGFKSRNPLGAIALAAILSGAMLAYGFKGEESA
jgi:hypothetical protein